MIVIADTTPHHYLILIHQPDILGTLYSRVLVSFTMPPKPVSWIWRKRSKHFSIPDSTLTGAWRKRSLSDKRKIRERTAKAKNRTATLAPRKGPNSRKRPGCSRFPRSGRRVRACSATTYRDCGGRLLPYPQSEPRAVYRRSPDVDHQPPRVARGSEGPRTTRGNRRA